MSNMDNTLKLIILIILVVFTIVFTIAYIKDFIIPKLRVNNINNKINNEEDIVKDNSISTLGLQDKNCLYHIIYNIPEKQKRRLYNNFKMKQNYTRTRKRKTYKK